MTGQSPFKKLFEDRQKPEPELPIGSLPPLGEARVPQPTYSIEKNIVPPDLDPPRRGRPLTGKRSDPNWIGRTYYVQKETDLDVEGALLQLKRQGIEMDKSELVNLLLGAWVKSQQGEDLNLQLSEIPPRRKI